MDAKVRRDLTSKIRCNRLLCDVCNTGCYERRKAVNQQAMVNPLSLQYICQRAEITSGVNDQGSTELVSLRARGNMQ